VLVNKWLGGVAVGAVIGTTEVHSSIVWKAALCLPPQGRGRFYLVAFE
jgi:hypothetical protein